MNTKFQNLTCSLEKKQSFQSMKIFDYIEMLDDKYGDLSVAYFHFQNFLVLQKFDNMKEQIMKRRVNLKLTLNLRILAFCGSIKELKNGKKKLS
jgi:hypothetical protein